jgi:hypothetical protein
MSQSVCTNSAELWSMYVACVCIVERIERSEMENILKRTTEELSQKCAKSDGVVHLRGLPFNCTKEEIASFFLGNFTSLLFC